MKLNFVIVFFMLLSIRGLANTYQFQEKLIWSDLKKVKSIEKTNKLVFYFEPSSPDADMDFLPRYLKKFRISNSHKIVKAEIRNAVYETLSIPPGADVHGIQLLKEGIDIDSYYTISRKERFGNVSFIPLRLKKGSKQVEKLVSFELVVTTSAENSLGNNKKLKSSHFASSSVLASGEWYKIGVTRNGVFKVSYSMMENLGMDMDILDPANIRLYGNGGGMLPERNSEFRHDDLKENAIQMVDGGDGKFDKNDYFLFYGESPHQWENQSNNERYYYKNNLYTDTTFYFINTDLGPGKRITSQPSSSATANFTVAGMDDYAVHDENNINLVKSGRDWFGEIFDAVTSYNFNFSFPNTITKDTAFMRVRVAAKSRSTSRFSVKVSGNDYNITVPAVSFNYPSPGGDSGNGNYSFLPNSSNLNVNVTYIKELSESRGWLDYIELNVRRRLTMNGTQMNFRDHRSVGPTRISEFTLQNAPNVDMIWDVTDPLNVKNQLFANKTASNITFRTPTPELKEFIAFSEPLSTVYPVGRVDNQNLHALGQYDMIILSHPNFLPAAQTLQQFHEDEGLRTVIVTPSKIYNEFSSGAQDLIAIRSFLRMMYERAANPTEFPDYFLIIGDASYDLKYRVSGNTNFVPAYQSIESFSLVSSFVSDDYFGLLDTNEGSWQSPEDVDVGIGRLPVKSLDEAQAVVNKIIHYKDVVTQRDWRNVIAFVGDDEDRSLHMIQSDALADTVQDREPDFNLNKIFLDAYKQQSTPGGQRYPDVEEALNRQVEQGALILNYTGHGGETGWAHESILDISDINAWSNFERMPLFITATCEFSRFDDPKRVSGGEYVLLNPNGGGIALFTTVRTVYSGDNFNLNTKLYQNIFEQDKNGHLRMGEVFRRIKNIVNTPNTRNFTLLGDPALLLNFPTYGVRTTTINGQPISQIDTVNALEKMTIEGYVVDNNGNKMTGYNGILYPTIYDKSQIIQTLNNDGEGSFSFPLQKNKLFKGKVSVTNGDFSFSFIVPKDIKYEYGNGKISFYAENSIDDANGYSNDVIIGGTSPNSANDQIGPEIELYMNDENFIYGGITDENPILLAKLRDEHGINMVGTGLGHDIIAVIDKNTDDAIVLNDYYEADIDSYQSGSVNYPFSNLSEGKHTLTLKAWDVYNNSSEATIEFVVERSKEIEIANVLNYPNPFTTRTEFWFEHNQANRLLDVQVQIFTVSGKLVKTIDRIVQTEGYSQNQINPIVWNARDEFGDKLGRGVYLYKLIVRSRGNGSIAEKIEKLVIL